MNAHKDDERPLKLDEKTPHPTLKVDDDTRCNTGSENKTHDSKSETTESALTCESKTADVIRTSNDSAATPLTESGAHEALETLFADAKSGAQKQSKSEAYATEKILKGLPRLWSVPAILLVCTFGMYSAFGITFMFGYFYWIFSVFKTAFTTKKLFNNVMNPWVPAGASLLPLVTIAILGNLIDIPSRFGTFPTRDVIIYFGGVALSTLITFAIQGFWMYKTSRELAKRYQGDSANEKETKRSALLHTLAYCLPLPLYLFVVYNAANVVPSIIGWSQYNEFRIAYFPILQPLLAAGLLASQFGGLWLFKKRVKEVARRQSSASIAKNAKPPLSDDDYVIPYHPFEELERWFKQRTSQRSTKKLLYVLVLVLIFMAVGAPQWTLDLLTSLARETGAQTEVAALKSANLFIINAVQLAIWAVMFLGVVIFNSKPTHIGMSKKGVRFLWRHMLFTKDGAYFDWYFMNRISLIMPRGKTAPTDQQIVFENRDKGPLHLRVGSIMETEQRARVLKAIEKFAPEVHRDAAVLQALEPPADHSYTELWLQALTAPPKRERFKPLTEGSKLHEQRFEIKRQLGVGGQGTAYLATDTESGEDIVLKEFILPVYVDVSVRRQSLERFENEARILKQLNHDQIVKLKDFFVEDHRSYLVLEHIDGQSLKEIVDRDGPLPEARVRELGKQMCDILHYLHGLEPPVVHRDFTPDNLILRKDGTLKLVDFNVAQQTESTATGTVVGKHAYLPPEQFRGTPGTRSDIYAMGATLHFLLTGKEPEPISVSHPKRINPEVSEQLNVTVEVATALSEEARYNNAMEVKSALE